MPNKVLVVLISIFFISCASVKNNSETIALKFLNEYEIPHNSKFEKTWIGGLSGIDYNAEKNYYYLICDDKAEHSFSRFYTAKIDIDLVEKRIDTIVFLNVYALKNEKNQPFSDFNIDPFASADPEDIRYNPNTKALFWTNEGERILKDSIQILRNPSITVMDTAGNYIESYEVPFNLRMQTIQKGPRRNGTLEGIAFSNDYRFLYTSLEEPLYEDGLASTTEKGGVSRIYKFDTKTKKNISQYAYQLEPVAYKATPENAFSVNGITALLSLNEKQLLTVERSYSTGRQACTIKIFLVSLQDATDIIDLNSLSNQSAYTKVNKTLLLDMDSLNTFVDNIEGITFGPNLPNGNKTLLLIADNNFSKKEKNQVFLLEVTE